MKAFLALPLAAGLAQAAYLVPRAVDCTSMMATINAANGLSKASTYCRAYLGLADKTTTRTNTNWKTATYTARTSTTTVRTTTPDVSTKNKVTRTTTVTTQTPAASTETEYITSTAYVDNDGNTVAIEKRDAMPTAQPDLAKRATKAAKPAFFNGLSKADLKAACLCLNLSARTITHTAKQQRTTTTTKSATYTIKKVAVAATPLTTVTATSTRTVTVNAPTPIVQETTVVFEDSNQCPPSTTTTYECPAGSGDDDFSDTDNGRLACPVVSEDDSLSGYCSYWDDDGSPYGSVLNDDDGTGNGSQRDATYGDDDTDDCPSWADYSCTNVGGTSRRRWFQERDLSPPSTGSSLTRQRKAMPKGLRRGGHRKYHDA